MLVAQNEPPEIELKTIPDYRFNLSYARNANEGVQHVELGLNKDIINVYQEKVRLGFGVRLGLQDNRDVRFTTAHATIKDKEANIDTLILDVGQSGAVNLYLNAEYQILKKLSVGVNLDLLGTSFGAEEKGVYRPGTMSQGGGYQAEAEVVASPTSANAFSMGNSKGGLNSQLYVRFEPARRFGIRAGLAYLFQEYSTARAFGSFSSYRYENNVPAFFIGVTFNRIEEK